MNIFSIILAIYAFIAVCVTLIMVIKANKPLNPLDEFVGNKRKPIWQICLYTPLYPLALLVRGIVLLVNPKERIRKSIKTSKDFEKEYNNLHIEIIDYENEVCNGINGSALLCLANELLKGKLSTFPLLLQNDATQVIYDEKYYRKIHEKNSIVDYWKAWITTQANQGITHKYKIVRARYFSSEALQIDYYSNEKRLIGSFLVIFHFNSHEKIQQIIFTKSHIYYTFFKDGKSDLLTILETLSPWITPTDISTGYFETKMHLPCLKCGRDSEKLIWFSSIYIAYGGNASFCPACKDLVEEFRFRHYYVDYSIDKFTINDNIKYIQNKLHTNSHIEAPEAESLIGRIWYFKENEKDVLSNIENLIDGSLKEQLEYAAAKGVYEAYNNLGTLFMGTDDEKAVEYFKIAAEHSVVSSMLNLSLWYYRHNDITKFVHYTCQASNANSIVGIYNNALTLHIGYEFGTNPMIEEAVDLYNRAIDESNNINNKSNFSNIVRQCSYFNLGLIYYKEYGTYNDLLQAYSYLNQCPTQNDRVRNLKICIYKKLLDNGDEMALETPIIKENDDDLPF